MRGLRVDGRRVVHLRRNRTARPAGAAAVTTVAPITARLPDFLVIGAPRAGTTTLARDLARLPGVWLPRKKELGFFDIRWTEGLDSYRRDFAAAPDGAVIGEATPTYLSAPGVLERIASALPDVRLVTILRDPVERFWSHYWYNRTARGVEGESPERVLELNPREYLEPGRYAHHLGRVLDLFDREQLHVVLLPDLRRAPEATYRELSGYLGVDGPLPEGLGSSHNESYAMRYPWLRRQMYRFSAWERLPGDLGYRIDEWNRVPIRRPEMPDDVRVHVERFYEDDTVALGELLGRPVPWAVRP